MKLLLSVSGKTGLVGGWGWKVEDSHDRVVCQPNFEKGHKEVYLTEF